MKCSFPFNIPEAIFDKDTRRKNNEEEEQRQGYVRFVVSLILHPKELDYNRSNCDRSVS